MKTNNDIYIIAEVGVNHNGSEEIAYELIDLASQAGADAVKFQMFYPEKLCSKKHRKEEIEMLNKYVVSLEELRKFRDYAYSLGLDFIVTPFDFRSLEEVASLNCSAIKIASGELTHIPFLIKAASYGQKIIISTGAANICDIERAVQAIKSVNNKKISILHCTSTYPTPNNYVNIKAINTLQKHFYDCKIGFSDHSLGNIADILAVSAGSKIIEKHITLDNTLEGPDHKASSARADFIAMVKNIRVAQSMLGDGEKVPQPCETKIGRSIVAKTKLNKDQILTEDDVDFKRPGYGLRPYELNNIIGLKLIRDIEEDELIQLEDFIKEGELNGK